MKRKHFNDLSLHDKLLLVDDMATEVCSIEFYDHRIHLYALSSIFIEAYHNIETGNIDRITVAEYGDLDKYLSRIILRQLAKKPGSYPGAL
jgi:hypothetical protein